MTLDWFKEIWMADFEFSAASGEKPIPTCLVAKEFRTSRLIRLWQDQLQGMSEPPYPSKGDNLFVAFYASAEMGCHLALSWPVPKYVLDLFTEFRVHTNGKPVPCGNTLLGAMAYFGLDAVSVAEKDSMRQLVLRGGPWTEDEKTALLNYCESDVLAVEKLLRVMA
jgi:DNA polymerase I